MELVKYKFSMSFTLPSRLHLIRIDNDDVVIYDYENESFITDHGIFKYSLKRGISYDIELLGNNAIQIRESTKDRWDILSIAKKPRS